MICHTANWGQASCLPRGVRVDAKGVCALLGRALYPSPVVLQGFCWLVHNTNDDNNDNNIYYIYIYRERERVREREITIYERQGA